MEQTDYAYIAGILDTMARITVMETPQGTHLPLIAVNTPNFTVLNYLSDVSGVTSFLTRRSYDRHRCTEHCEEAHDHVVSTSARWSVSGAKATVMLNCVRPFMSMQTEDADRALDAGLGAPFKRASLHKMVLLGWDLPEEWKKVPA